MKRPLGRTLARRMQRLEEARGVSPDPHFPHLIIVHFVSRAKDGGPRPEPNYAKLRDGDREWHRGPDETGDAFEARIRAEAQAEGRLVTVFLSATDDMLL